MWQTIRTTLPATRLDYSCGDCLELRMCSCRTKKDAPTPTLGRQTMHVSSRTWGQSALTAVWSPKVALGKPRKARSKGHTAVRHTGRRCDWPPSRRPYRLFWDSTLCWLTRWKGGFFSCLTRRN